MEVPEISSRHRFHNEADPVLRFPGSKKQTFAWTAAKMICTMEDLTIARVMEVHSGILPPATTDSRVLSEANLHQLVFHANAVPECVPRAAFAFWFLCAYPAFREGNFQTALATAELVLASGGYRLTGDIGGLCRFAESIAGCTTDPEDVEDWLLSNVRKK